MSAPDKTMSARRSSGGEDTKGGQQYWIQDIRVAPVDIENPDAMRNFSKRGFQAFTGTLRSGAGHRRVFVKVYRNPDAFDSFQIEALWPSLIADDVRNKAFMKKHFCLPENQFCGSLRHLFGMGECELYQIEKEHLEKHCDAATDHKSDQITNASTFFLSFPLVSDGQDLLDFCRSRRDLVNDALSDIKRWKTQLDEYARQPTCSIDTFKRDVAVREYEKALNDYKQNTPSPIVFREMFKQLGSALKFLHGYGLAHNDVDPSNIMVCCVNGKYVFKLVDFGVCTKTQTKEPFTGRAFLTPPEWVRWDGSVSLETVKSHQFSRDKADLFALGICLFAAMTYSPPWECKSRWELLRDVKYKMMTRKNEEKRTNMIRRVADSFWKQLYTIPGHANAAPPHSDDDFSILSALFNPDANARKAAYEKALDTV